MGTTLSSLNCFNHFTSSTNSSLQYLQDDDTASPNAEHLFERKTRDFVNRKDVAMKDQDLEMVAFISQKRMQYQLSHATYISLVNHILSFINFDLSRFIQPYLYDIRMQFRSDVEMRHLWIERILRRDIIGRFSCFHMDWRWFTKDDEELARYALGLISGVRSMTFVDRREDCIEGWGMSEEKSYEAMWEAVKRLVKQNTSTLLSLHVIPSQALPHAQRYQWWSQDLAASMTRLRQLSIGSIQSTELSEMRELRWLRIFSQRICLDFPNESQITYLHFASSHIPVTREQLNACTSLAQLSELLVLNASQFASTSELENFAHSLKYLQKLTLRFLPKSIDDISPLSSLPLHSLDISNSLSSFAHTSFDRFQSLHSFTADNTPITDEVLMKLSKCPLTKFSLRFCQCITDKSVSCILSSPLLESIDLSSASVTDNCILFMTEENHSVSELHLSHNKNVSDACGEKLLTYLPSLIKLYISATSISDKTIASLYASPFLRTLYISSNPQCTHHIGQFIRFMRITELSTDMEGHPESFGWIMYQDLESLRITSGHSVEAAAQFVIQSKKLTHLEVSSMAFSAGALRQIAREKSNLHSLRLYLPFDDPLVSFLFIHSAVPEIIV